MRTYRKTRRESNPDRTLESVFPHIPTFGTEWVAPGQGAIIDELMEAIMATPLGLPGRQKPLADLIDLCVNGHALQSTALRLTGKPLTDYDLRRISVEISSQAGKVVA